MHLESSNNNNDNNNNNNNNNNDNQNENENENENMCTSDACNNSCNNKSDDVAKAVNRRKSRWPAAKSKVMCAAEDGGDEDFQVCLQAAFGLLRAYVTRTLGLRNIVVLSVMGTKNIGGSITTVISPQLSIMEVCLLPDGRVVVVSFAAGQQPWNLMGIIPGIGGTIEENENAENGKKVSFTFFGRLQADGPKRLSSWLRQKAPGISHLEFTIHAVGPKHAFGPAEHMLLTQLEPGDNFALTPDHHYVYNLYQDNIQSRREGLPTESISTPGTLAYDTHERFNELEGNAGANFLLHKFQTPYQQTKFEEETESICSATAVAERKVIGIWDYKRNIELTQKYNQLKSDYYNIPTAAFFGLVIVFCKHGLPHAINLDVTSASHEKSAAWVAATVEILFRLTNTRPVGQEQPPAASTLDTNKWLKLSEVMSGFDVFEEAKAVLCAARVLSFWGDNGAPFHSGNLISMILSGFPAGNLGEDVARGRVPVPCQPDTVVQENEEEPARCGISVNFFAVGEGKNRCDSHFAHVELHLRRFTKQYPLDAKTPDTYRNWLRALGDTERSGIRGLKDTAVIILSVDAIEDYMARHTMESTAEGLKKYMQFATPFLPFKDEGVVEKVSAVIPAAARSSRAADELLKSKLNQLASNAILTDLDVVECGSTGDDTGGGTSGGMGGGMGGGTGGHDGTGGGGGMGDNLGGTGEVPGTIESSDGSGGGSGGGGSGGEEEGGEEEEVGEVGEVGGTNGNNPVNEADCHTRAGGLTLKVKKSRSGEISFQVINRGRGYLDNELVLHDESEITFKIQTIPKQKYLCRHGCILGSHMSYVNSDTQNRNDVVVIPLLPPKERDTRNYMRSAPLDIQRDATKHAMTFFKNHMSTRWKEKCPAPGFCLINMADRLVREADELKRMLINNVVVSDLRSFLSHNVFRDVRFEEIMKRRTAFSLAAGLGDRWIYMIIKLKNPELACTIKQQKLLQDSKPSQAQLTAYEEAVADSNFIRTKLQLHLSGGGEL